MTVKEVINKINELLGRRRKLTKILGIFDKAEAELQEFVKANDAEEQKNAARIATLNEKNRVLGKDRSRAKSVLQKINDLTSSGRESNPEFNS